MGWRKVNPAGKEEAAEWKAEKMFCCFDVPEDLIVFVTRLPIQSHRLSSGTPRCPLSHPN